MVYLNVYIDFFQAYCTDATLMLKIKDLIMLFVTSLRVTLIISDFFYFLLYYTYTRLYYYTVIFQYSYTMFFTPFTELWIFCKPNI